MSILMGVAEVVLEASPWLVLGLVAAGLVRAFLPADLVARWMGGRGPGSVTVAAFLGAPLPLCSCGVLPVAIGLRERGASKGATASFLVATPETGLDSIALSYALLGPFFAVARPIAAIATAIAAGLAVLGVDRGVDGLNAEGDSGGGGGLEPCCSGDGGRAGDGHKEVKSCCVSAGNTGGTPVPPGIGVARLSEPGVDSDARGESLLPTAPTESCCGSESGSRTGETPVPLGMSRTGETPVPRGWVARVVEGQRYSFGKLLADIALWLGIGLVFAGVMRGLVDPGALASISGIWAMLAALVAGVPLYICASAATPIAAGLLATGVSPGVALVLLLAGPATNIGSIGVIRKHIGGRATAAYLAAIVVMSLAAGLIVEWMIDRMDIDIIAQVGAGGRHVPQWLAVGSAVVLGVGVLRPIVRRYGRVWT